MTSSCPPKRRWCEEKSHERRPAAVSPPHGVATAETERFAGTERCDSSPAELCASQAALGVAGAAGAPPLLMPKAAAAPLPALCALPIEAGAIALPPVREGTGGDIDRRRTLVPGGTPAAPPPAPPPAAPPAASFCDVVAAVAARSARVAASAFHTRSGRRGARDSVAVGSDGVGLWQRADGGGATAARREGRPPLAAADANGAPSSGTSTAAEPRAVPRADVGAPAANPSG